MIRTKLTALAPTHTNPFHHRLISVAICTPLIIAMFYCDCLCSQAQQGRPPALESVAAAFRSAAVSNRVEEARDLLKILPTCPVISTSGTLRGVDLSKPSYVLTDQDVTNLCGIPSRVERRRDGGNGYTYWLGKSDQFGTWYMAIETVNGKVVWSVLSAEKQGPRIQRGPITRDSTFPESNKTVNTK